MALFRHLPQLSIPWVTLGEFPTPLEELDCTQRSGPLLIKREDLSSPYYGGNKVRTLEAHLGRAKAFGAKEVWATGAYGSNHAIATVTHGQRIGLETGVMLWPQPPTETAQRNMRAMLSKRPYVWPLASVVTLPLGMTRLPRRARAPVYLMSPGGATIEGAIAHISAALELAEQIDAAGVPTPEAVVVAVGSTCTSAGLLAGVHLAARFGIAFRDRVPRIHAVRVTPWPITSRLRIARFAAQTFQAVTSLAGLRMSISTRELYAGLRVDHRYLGRGYGRPTRRGRVAQERMASLGGPRLDDVYSAKSGAAFFSLAKRIKNDRPLVFWATKSSAPLPDCQPRELRLAPRTWRRWLDTAPL